GVAVASGRVGGDLLQLRRGELAPAAQGQAGVGHARDCTQAPTGRQRGFPAGDAGRCGSSNEAPERHSWLTAVTVITASPASSLAARSTSALIPQSWSP